MKLGQAPSIPISSELGSTSAAWYIRFPAKVGPKLETEHDYEESAFRNAFYRLNQTSHGKVISDTVMSC
jgi:hypothetical protein